MDIWQKWEEWYSSLGINPKDICHDGIVNENKDIYANLQQRVLFVLRDTNDARGNDLLDLLRTGPRYQTWHTIARWAAGILNKFPHYSQIDKLDVMSETLKNVAVINLKKKAGRSSADLNEINLFAFQDRQLLRKQIECINPNIIVACGTFDSVLWLLEPSFDSSNIDKHFARKDDLTILSWYHPTRVNNEQSYEDLRRLWNKAMLH